MNSDEPCNVQTVEKPPIPPRELAGVLVLISCFLVFNLFTCNFYPAVWCDEASYSEPGLNFVRTGSFHTHVWYGQPPATFPVANCPAYFVALGLWAKLAGTSLLAVRSLNYTLIAVASGLLCFAMWRFRFVQLKGAMVWLVALLHLGYGTSFAFRCSRPDELGLICLLCMVLSFGLNSDRLRWTCLFALALVTVWIGLQVGFFAAFACGSAWLLLDRVRWKDVLAVALGLIAGASSLWLFLAWEGLLPYFLSSISLVVGKRYAGPVDGYLGASMVKIFHGTLVSYVEDFSAVPILLGLVLIATKFWTRLARSSRRLLLYLIVLSVGTPLLFNLTGHWVLYYSYLKFIPAVLAFLLIGSEIKQSDPPGFERWIKPMWIGSAILAMLLGLPLRLGVALVASKITPKNEIQAMLARHINSRDVVFSEYATFFEAKQVAPVVYNRFSSYTLQPWKIQGRDLSLEERAEISALIVRPRDAAKVIQFMGGEWRAVSEPFGDTQDFRRLSQLPLLGARFASYATQPQTERYKVQIFRRVNPPPISSEPEAGQRGAKISAIGKPAGSSDNSP